jgi:hypothetical protein
MENTLPLDIKQAGKGISLIRSIAENIKPHLISCKVCLNFGVVQFRITKLPDSGL